MGTHPSCWNDSPAMPLHKKGAVTIPLNYRIIAFMSAMCKLYDGCLAARLQAWTDDHGLLSNTQFGYRRQSECCDMWSVYKSVIQQRMREGIPTWMISLDVKKAFPSVPRFFIWNKLHDSGMAGRFLLSLINMSDSARLWILVAGMTSLHDYPLTQGVREGSLTSPLLYIIFADSIITCLRMANLGITAEGVYVGAALFADDLSNLLETATQVQRTLNMIYARGILTRTQYNAAKTAIPHFDPANNAYVLQVLNINQHTFYMGDIAFNTVTKHILLGIRYTSKLSFGPQLEYLRTQVKSQTADLVAAGVHPGGLDMHTSISMWRFIYTPKFSSSIHIWIETHMHTELTSIILAPLRAILNAHPGIGTTVMDDLTLCVELRVSGSQSLLLHTTNMIKDI